MSVSQFVTEVGDVVSHFNITKVQVEDGGVYECTVSNRAGQVSHSAKLQVYGKHIADFRFINRCIERNQSVIRKSKTPNRFINDVEILSIAVSNTSPICTAKHYRCGI